MLRLLKTPKIILAFTLILILITAFIQQLSLTLFLRIITSIILAISIDLILLKIRKIEFFFPSASIITALIVNLLLAPDRPFFELIVTILIALLLKQFVRVKGKHIFNPAAAGLLIGGLVFRHTVSWWGVSWQQFSIPFIILLLPAYVSCISMRRYKIVISFLVVYNLIIYVLTQTVAIFDPTVLFFSLVMLPEPMTSPSDYRSQIFFGIFVALFSFAASFSILSLLPDPLITSLLLGNLLFFRWR